MPNLEWRIDAHIKSILRERPQQPEKMCNGRSKPDCPLKGECLTTNVIYQATVEPATQKTYIGLTGDLFKTRYNNHTCSFRDNSKRNYGGASVDNWRGEYSCIMFCIINFF